MKKCSCLIAVALALSAAVCANAETTEDARVIVPAPKDVRHHHLSWPKIVKTADGTLIVAYIAGRKHAGGDGCPAISISNDGGKSFSEPNILKIFDSSMPYQHCANLAMGVAPDGAIILMGMAFTNNKRNNIYCWRSTDKGKNWNLTDTSALGESKTGSVFGHVFNVPEKGLAVCGHYRKPKGFGIWISYSKDQGLTWQPPETICEKMYFEPTFIYTSDGKLTGLVREDSANAYHQFTSDNLGTSWKFDSCAIQGNPKAGHPSPFIVEDPVAPGTFYALQTERTGKKEIYLWVAKGSDFAWKRVCLAVAAPGHADFGYPWMVHLKGREWFLVYYAGENAGPNSIYGKTVHIRPSVVLRAGAPAPDRARAALRFTRKTALSYGFRRPPSTPAVKKLPSGPPPRPYTRPETGPPVIGLRDSRRRAVKCSLYVLSVQIMTVPFLSSTRDSKWAVRGKRSKSLTRARR